MGEGLLGRGFEISGSQATRLHISPAQLLPVAPPARRPVHALLLTGIDRGVQCLNNYGFQANRRVACTWRWNQSLGEGPFYLNFSE